MTTIYEFNVKKQDGTLLSLNNYKGNVLLVVNTATGCGFTPQYEGLQTLYEQFHDKGFEVLDFPCNQFKQQAAGTAEEINTFCSLNYNTSFPRFAKIEVNGKNADPLYQWMKEEKKGTFGKVVEWNFTKFLIDRNGNVVKRFSSATKPEDMVKDIEALL